MQTEDHDISDSVLSINSQDCVDTEACQDGDAMKPSAWTPGSSNGDAQTAETSVDGFKDEGDDKPGTEDQEDVDYRSMTREHHNFMLKNAVSYAKDYGLLDGDAISAIKDKLESIVKSFKGADALSLTDDYGLVDPETLYDRVLDANKASAWERKEVDPVKALVGDAMYSWYKTFDKKREYNKESYDEERLDTERVLNNLLRASCASLSADLPSCLPEAGKTTELNDIWDERMCFRMVELMSNLKIKHAEKTATCLSKCFGYDDSCDVVKGGTGWLSVRTGVRTLRETEPKFIWMHNKASKTLKTATCSKKEHDDTIGESSRALCPAKNVVLPPPI